MASVAVQARQAGLRRTARRVYQVAAESSRWSRGSRFGLRRLELRSSASWLSGQEGTEYFTDRMRRWQANVAAVYDAPPMQYAVAVIIGTNFIANIVQAQIDPRGRKYVEQFLAIEDAFNMVFLVELIVNLYAHWFRAFWTGWNIFDLVVVAVGMLSVARAPLPGPLSMLRMLRAFRVFRLFKRIKSLNKIMMSLFKAIPGILNSALIMVLVMCIYSILGVQFFGKFGEDGTYRNSNNVTCVAVTGREITYGEEYWGTFSASLLTNFQILTAESWGEVIARPILAGDVSHKGGGAIYFVTYIIINAMILFNVVIAVLLDKCMTQEDEGEEAPPAGDDAADFESPFELVKRMSHSSRNSNSNLAMAMAQGNRLADLFVPTGSSGRGHRPPASPRAQNGASSALQPEGVTAQTAAKLRTLRGDVGSFTNQLAIVLAAVHENQAQLDGLKGELRGGELDR